MFIVVACCIYFLFTAKRKVRFLRVEAVSLLHRTSIAFLGTRLRWVAGKEIPRTSKGVCPATREKRRELKNISGNAGSLSKNINFPVKKKV